MHGEYDCKGLFLLANWTCGSVQICRSLQYKGEWDLQEHWEKAIYDWNWHCWAWLVVLEIYSFTFFDLTISNPFAYYQVLLRQQLQQQQQLLPLHPIPSPRHQPTPTLPVRKQTYLD